MEKLSNLGWRLSSSRLTFPKSLLTLGFLSSAFAWWLIAPPVMTFGSTAKHAGHFGLVYFHVPGGTLMLFVGLANLYVGTTRKYFKYHKLLVRSRPGWSKELRSDDLVENSGSLVSPRAQECRFLRACRERSSSMTSASVNDATKCRDVNHPARRFHADSHDAASSAASGVQTRGRATFGCPFDTREHEP